MPWPRLREWMAYAQIEPFGGLQEDLRAGVIGSMAISPWMKEGKRIRPEDLFPSLRSGVEAMSDEEMRDRLMAWARACQGAK